MPRGANITMRDEEDAEIELPYGGEVGETELQEGDENGAQDRTEKKPMPPIKVANSTVPDCTAPR